MPALIESEILIDQHSEPIARIEGSDHLFVYDTERVGDFTIAVSQRTNEPVAIFPLAGRYQFARTVEELAALHTLFLESANLCMSSASCRECRDTRRELRRREGAFGDALADSTANFRIFQTGSLVGFIDVGSDRVSFDVAPEPEPEPEPEDPAIIEARTARMGELSTLIDALCVEQNELYGMSSADWRARGERQHSTALRAWRRGGEEGPVPFTPDPHILRMNELQRVNDAVNSAVRERDELERLAFAEPRRRGRRPNPLTRLGILVTGGGDTDAEVVPRSQRARRT